MSGFWSFEFKETYGIKVPSGWLLNPPSKPGYIPRIEDLIIIGVCYRANPPTDFLSPDEAYDRAINARYYVWRLQSKAWEELGEASSFMKALGEKINKETRYPEVFQGHPKFKRWRSVQIHPWRELIRRHLTRSAYVADIDMIIKR